MIFRMSLRGHKLLRSSVLFLLLSIFVSPRLDAKYNEIQKTETRVYAVSAGTEFVMLTDDGDIRLHTWDKDSIRIEIVKHARGRTERKAKLMLEKISIDVRSSEKRLVLQEHYQDKDDFSILDLFEPANWHERKRIDYKVIVPQGLICKIKHDDGDILAENIRGSVHISLDEGEVQLSNLVFNTCRVEIDEGKLLLKRMTGEKNSEMQLYCDEGVIHLDSVSVDQVNIEVDEGRVRMKNADIDRFECLIDEGHIHAEIYPDVHGRYILSCSEGDIAVTLLNQVPMRVAIYCEDGRITSNLGLKIRRSEESEQVRGSLGEPADAYFKLYTDEGDIQFDLYSE